MISIFPLIAFLEGFTTLAFQMVALRKAVPYVGSSIVLTSVVIGVILLALSAGYYAGGVLTSRLSTHALLRRLQIYLVVSALYYLLIVYPSFEFVLTWGLQYIGFVPTLFVFATVFFAIPTFLASHTMPIITHITQGTKGYAAGKILFISTLGSFLGSTLTTLVLFPYMGVYWTGVLASAILIICSLLVSSHKKSSLYGLGLLLLLGIAAVTSPYTQGYYKETPYQTIKILHRYFDGQPVRLLQMNGGLASGIYTDTGKSFFNYVRKIIDAVQETKPKKIAVIGAAGCTIPQELAQLDFVHSIDVVDIDGAVFQIAEKEFLQQPLSQKINPITQSARGWLYDMQKKGVVYDMIIVDVYNGISLPDEVVTQEFFTALHNVSKTIVMNIITDVGFESDFSQSLFASMQQVLPSWYRTDANYSTGKVGEIANFIMTDYAFVGYEKLSTSKTPAIFTDDKNIADEKRVGMMFAK